MFESLLAKAFGVQRWTFLLSEQCSLLAMDTTPGNTDSHDFPAKPAKWQYRAIYHAGDSRVGEWSNSVSVTVVG